MAACGRRHCGRDCRDRAVARELDATATQVVLAWLLRRSRVIAPIPGTASLGHLTENLTAAGVEITDDQYERLDRIAAPTVQ